MGFFLPEYIPLMDSVVCASQPGAVMDSFFSGWYSISIAALVTSVILIGFFYMLAAIFQNQKAIALAKIELYEIAVTGVIFVIVLMMVNGMCSVNTGWFFPSAGHTSITGDFTSWADKSIYYTSSNYLVEFADYTLKTMSLQYGAYVFIDWVTSMEISSTPMGIGATMRPTSGLGSVLKPVLNNAFTAEIIGTVTAQAQVYVMDYGTYGMLKYFLPLGLILRSFYLTRRIGGTLIAITLVFLFIYPLLVIPSYLIINDSLLSNISYFERGEYAGVWGTGAYVMMFVEFLLKWVWGAHFLLGYALSVMPMLAKIFLGAVFMPLFNTIIIVNAARYLSRSLGEEVDITNFTRMI